MADHEPTQQTQPEESSPVEITVQTREQIVSGLAKLAEPFAAKLKRPRRWSLGEKDH